MQAAVRPLPKTNQLGLNTTDWPCSCIIQYEPLESEHKTEPCPFKLLSFYRAVITAPHTYPSIAGACLEQEEKRLRSKRLVDLISV